LGEDSFSDTNKNQSRSIMNGEEEEDWEWLEEHLAAEKEAHVVQKDDETGHRWNGWGFEDFRFVMGDDGVLRATGTRYADVFGPDAREFPEFAEWAENELQLDLDEEQEPASKPTASKYNGQLVRNEAFEKELLEIPHVEVSVKLDARLRASHGQSVQEVYSLRRMNKVPWRLPDMVVTAASHEGVVRIVEAAVKHKCVIVPCGGGSSVTQALQTNQHCIALDTRRMNKIKWIDRNNMMACIEAGAYGFEIDKKLNKLGVTMGHEPDSMEFSTLGGWIATKSSGMKKNMFGNIEDIVIDLKLVTPSGVLHRGTPLERVSVGPDPVQLAIGSEGIFGVITEAVVRLRLKPKFRAFESFVFSNFKHGCGAMREIALLRVAPASVRLVDNAQFKMGQALKGPAPKKGLKKLKHDLVDRAKKYYVLEYNQFDPDELCAMTLVFEGNDQDRIRHEEACVARICRKYGGIRGGEESAKRGYNLTFMIAYLRDFGLNFNFLSESFETTVKWSDVTLVYDKVMECIRREAAEMGLPQPLVSGRLTQTYDSCATLYFYFGINLQRSEIRDPIKAFSRIEDAAREEILQCGGSLSHHHGVGKIRKRFYERATTPMQRRILQAVKASVDPSNVFSVGNLVDGKSHL